ncbi:MAG TPA: adenylate/guanylate cyclase domain-containing protein [Stellaceae bacterium]|nr:adenylate/guanylate cyclase domain-containing protein [Stellaceae bacterium]
MRLRRGVRSAGLALIGAAVVVLLFTVFADNPVVRGLETASLDLRFRLRGVRRPGPEVAIILIDDRSLESLGRWPLSRALFARALEVLDQAGAKVVAFDLLFTEPDEPVPADLRDTLRAAVEPLTGDRGDRLRAALQRLDDSDRDSHFAAVIRASGNVLLPIGLSFVDASGEEPSWLSDSAYARFDRSPLSPIFTWRPKSAVLPIEKLGAAAAGLGHTSFALDRDGAPRYDYVALPFEADFLPSLPIRAAAAYLGVGWSQVALALGAGVRIGDLTVPTDRAMRLLINCRGPPRTFPTFSFADLLAGRVAPENLSGRIVLIGASFVGSGDSYAQPFGNTLMPGVERIANVIDTIISRDFIGAPSGGWRVAVMAVILLVAALAGAMTEFLPTRFAALAGAAPIAAWAATAQLAFAKNLWLPLIEPVAALATAAATVLLFRYWVVDRVGRRIRSAFCHYLAPSLVEQLVDSGAELRLGGERREVTIMFADLSGFTALSTRLSPEELMALTNSYHALMVEAVEAFGGYVNQFVGDAVMAIFGAPVPNPDHAACAARAALRVVASVMQAKADADRRGVPGYAVKIGINSGPAVVGNVGAPERYNYTAVGETVNIAARLEGVPEDYGCRIVVGPNTAAAIGDRFVICELDWIKVKGKDTAFSVYQLIGEKSAASEAELACLAQYETGLERYRAGDFAAAEELWRCEGEHPNPGATATSPPLVMAGRCARLKAAPPESWDGVYVRATK